MWKLVKFDPNHELDELDMCLLNTDAPRQQQSQNMQNIISPAF